MLCSSTKLRYEVWVVKSDGFYQRLIFDRQQDGQTVINNLTEYNDWNFTI